MDLITREAAYAAGATYFFTGRPCKWGHIAPRYVSTGQCKNCLNKFGKRRHPHRSDLEPYVCPTLWVPKGTTAEQFLQLETYLATCVAAFFLDVECGL